MQVLLAERDEDYAAIIAELLRRDGHDVAIAGNVAGALRLAERQQPEVAVLDALFSDGSAADIAAALRAQHNHMPMIFIANQHRVDEVVRGFAAGADDYIIKPLHPSEFLARVRAVLRRAATADPVPVGRSSRITGRGLEFDDVNHAAYLDGSNLNCTRLEYDILRELAAVPGEVLSHEFLNERVWNYSHLNDGRLLKGHISSLRRKLRDATGRDDTIRTVHGVGYSYTAA